MLPLADIATIIKIIIFLVVLASWVMRAISEAQESATARKKSRERKARQPVPPRPIDPMEEPALRARAERAPEQLAPVVAARREVQEQRAVAGRDDKSREGKMREEVDEFLRQAGRSEPRRKPERPKRIELIDVPEEPQPKRERRLVDSEQSLPRPVPPVTPKPSPARMLSESSEIARHVAEHLSTGKLSEHAAQLGREIGQSDERLEARLQAKFDHKLGKLDDGNDPVAGTVTAQEAPLAAEILAMMSSPSGMRQAVILNEILTRPSDRW